MPQYRFYLLSLLFYSCSIYAQPTSMDRMALVIGVKNYASVSPLQNTLNDARDMADALKAKGFQVIELYDPQTKRQMQDAIVEYFQLLRKNKNTAGIVFYSGHGMQVDGSNYLIPARANPQIKADLEDQCLNMDYVMRAIEEAGNPLNIFILDACRNNPFRGFYRSNEQGLNMVATPKGSYIVYATKPGSVASDGSGRNGLFTSKLLKYLAVEGLNIEQVFKRVASDVSVESNDAQRPWIASDYSGDFFFTPGTVTSESFAQPLAAPTVVFKESFSENANKWLVKETDSYSFRISNGKYQIKSKAGGSWFASIPIQFNTNQDYEISATLRKIDGTDGYYYGLVLGFNTENRFFHFFGITGWGNVALANNGPAPYDKIPTAINPVVVKGNSTNHLVLKKIGNTFKAYVNGQFVSESAAEEFFGEYFGFQLWSGTESLTIEVDDLTIKTIR